MRRRNWKPRSKAGSAASLRVIADHARATAFLITDGVLPSNEGRGYVLRKIMRRAINHGRMLGTQKPFLHKMTRTVCNLMQDAYPELVQSAELVSKVMYSEEQQFARTLELGLKEWDSLLRQKIVQRLLSELDDEKPTSADAFTHAFGIAIKRNDSAVLFEAIDRELGPTRAQRFRQQWNAKDVPPVRIEGEEAFRLYDTFGLSLDFMQDMARDQGHQLDIAGFERAMQEQRTRARASWKGGSKEAANPAYAKLAETFKTEPDFYPCKTMWLGATLCWQVSTRQGRGSSLPATTTSTHAPTCPWLIPRALPSAPWSRSSPPAEPPSCRISPGHIPTSGSFPAGTIAPLKRILYTP